MKNVLFIAPTTYKLPLDKNMRKKFEYLSEISNLNVIAFANEKKEINLENANLYFFKKTKRESLQLWRLRWGELLQTRQQQTETRRRRR